MGRATVLIALLVVASVGIMPQVAGANDDKWPDACETPLIQQGTINGEISTASDTDSFRMKLQRGQYLSIQTDIDSSKSQEPVFYLPMRNQPSPQFGSNLGVRGLIGGSKTNRGIFLDGEKNTHSFELWAKTDGYGEGNGICMYVGDDSWETPYNWELTIERSDPDVTLFEVRELEDRIVELQNELDEAEGNSERISELESQLEEKNQTISQLRQESGDVAINVEVVPAGDQQNFITGGEARITANSENAEWNQFSIEYKGDTYSVDSSGTATVPLSGTGEQQMTFRYGDTTQRVSFNVKSQSDGQDDTSGENTAATDSDGDGIPDSQDYAPRDPDVQVESDVQNQEDDDSSGALGPGFGVVAALIALLAVAFLLGRYQ